MGERVDHTAQFRKPAHAPDKRVAGVRATSDVGQQLMAMIRPKNNIIIAPPDLYAAILLIKKDADERDHIRIASQMRGFLERPIRLLVNISQMGKVNSVGKLAGYLRHIIVRMRAK